MRDNVQRIVPSGESQQGGDPALLIRLAWANRWQSCRLSVEYAEQAKSLLCGVTGDRARVRRALADVTLSWQSKWRGEFDDALGFALKAEQNLPEIRFPAERAELYSIMAVVHYSRHRLDLADGAVQRGFTLVTPEADPDAYADLMTSSATICRHGGDLRTAGEVLGKARNIATGAMLARVEHNVARWMHADNAPNHALEHAETAIKLCVKHQNNVVLPYAHEVAGACLVELDQFDRAEAHFTKGLDLATKDRDARAQCQIIGWFAGLENKRCDFERARALYRFGQEIAKRMNYTLWQKTFARRLADVYEELGDLAKSVECHKLAWKLEEDKRH